uniref:Putative glycosyltransferase n=1 Tax=viral metagenome TaxID=1070528 RepID=A0A6M3MG96_9ZZZZ
MKKEIIWLSPPDVGASENVMNTWRRFMEKEGWHCDSEKPSFIFAGSDSQLEKAFELSEKHHVPVVCYFWGYPSQRLLIPAFRQFVSPKINMLASCFSVVCPTELIAYQLADFGIPANICQPGVDLSLISPMPSTKSIGIISIGRLEPLKGFDDLIVAISQAKFTHTLTIIGEGSQKDALYKLAKQLGVSLVILEGIDDKEKFRLLQKAKLFVCPSYYEGFGLPILEASTVSLPIIARQLPVYTFLYGDNITYFKTTKELAEAIDNPTLPVYSFSYPMKEAVTELSDLFSVFANRLEKLRLGNAIRIATTSEEVKNIYEEDAKLNWDYSAHRFSPHWHRHWRVEHAVKALKGKTVLDLGCSYGAYAIRFAELGFEVTGVDFSKTYLDKAKELAIQYKVKIDFFEADLTSRLPFEDRSFDSVWAGEVFEHLSPDNLPFLIQEISRLLILDGVFIFSTPLGQHHDDPLHLQHWDLKELTALLKKIFKTCNLELLSLKGISEHSGQELSCAFGTARKTH